MSTKKKPSFDITDDVKTSSQSGWVYRSDGGASADGDKRRRAAPTRRVQREPGREARRSGRPGSGMNVMGTTARTMSSSIQIFGSMLALGTRILAAPLTISLRILGFSRN